MSHEKQLHELTRVKASYKVKLVTEFPLAPLAHRQLLKQPLQSVLIPEYLMEYTSK